jgi:penicillin-binding protein 1C
VKRIHFLSILLLIGGIYICWPPVTDFEDLPFSSLVVDEDQNLLSAHIATDGQWRLPLLDGVPDKFTKCIVTFEDKRFYRHNGIDLFAIGRAIRINYQAGQVRSGGSTIPMQLVRLSRNHPPRVWSSKISEAIMAWKLSLWHSKESVLEWYTSLAPFGGNVVGLEAASWRYFGKKPALLSWAESATLAVLPNAPSLIHVNRNRDQLLAKRNKLLKKLELENHISALDLEASLAEPLPQKVYALPSHAPHYLQFSKSRTSNRKPLSSSIQQKVNGILVDLGAEWEENEIYNAGALILDIESGRPLAYAGNIPNTREERHVDMVQAHRSSGSILKPFLYAFMIDEGLLAPKSLIRDVPIYINGFSPSNYNKTFSGLTPVDEALQRSLNVPSVLMLQFYGIDKFLHRLKKIGITTLNGSSDYYGLSLILGGGEVTLWELAKAYRYLALSTNKQSQSSISPSAAFQTLDALKGLNRPDEEGNWQRFNSSKPIAWKTGTSYGNRDAWAVGVTPELVIATWVGNADGEGREGIIGSVTAGRLLFRIANNIRSSAAWFTMPYEDMEWMSMCKVSGMLGGSNCPEIDTSHMPLSVVHTEVCNFHQMIYVDSSEQHRLNEHCGKQGIYMQHFSVDPLSWQYMKLSHPEIRELPPLHPDCTLLKSEENNMAFVHPSQGDKILLPIDLNGLEQELVVQMAHQSDDATIHWYLDKRYLASTNEFHTISIKPRVGYHSITAVDYEGSELKLFFEILPHE